MKAICISSSNMINTKQEGVSYKISQLIGNIIMANYSDLNISYKIVELKTKTLSPCYGCGKCFELQKCCYPDDFNEIYDLISGANLVFIVSPHYAPIPAKLCMLLEKMEQISFLRWNLDNEFRPKVYNIPVGIISHGGGGDCALKEYKKVVNDTIANALYTIMMKVIAYDEEWKTGIAIPVKECIREGNEIFSKQIYDWEEIENNRLKPLIKNVIDNRRK